jgi:hypothetical protein
VVHALQTITRQLLRQKAIRPCPIRKVTTPVPVEGGVAGGTLAVNAGSSPHRRRKPNGSACQRRTMAEVHDEAKHAIRAMSPSCEVKKPPRTCGRRRAQARHDPFPYLDRRDDVPLGPGGQDGYDLIANIVTFRFSLGNGRNSGPAGTAVG